MMCENQTTVQGLLRHILYFGWTKFSGPHRSDVLLSACPLMRGLFGWPTAAPDPQQPTHPCVGNAALEDHFRSWKEGREEESDLWSRVYLAPMTSPSSLRQCW